MQEDVLVKALSDCLSSLESFISAAILLAIAVIWPALRGKSTLEFMSMKVERQYAIPVLSSIYLAINLAVLILFLRLAFLLQLLPDGECAKSAMDTIATHSWILNPYSFFGNSLAAQLYSASTYGLLIVVWWFCFASMHVLGDSPKTKIQKRLEGIFLGVGLASMLAMQWAGLLMWAKIGKGIEGYDGINTAVLGKGVMSFISIGLGAFIFALFDNIKEQLDPKASKSTNQANLTSDLQRHPSNECLHMTGLPLLFSGWNGSFYRTTGIRNGRDVWVRPSHWYKGFFPLRIVGVTIWFDGNKWILKRDCDDDNVAMIQSLHSNQTPAGAWERNIAVKSANGNAKL